MTKIVPASGVIYNDTGSEQFVESGLDGTAMQLGVSLAAASAGTKTLRTSVYGNADTYCQLSFNFQLSLFPHAKSTATTWVHDGKAQLAGIARAKASTPRLAFQSGPANAPTYINKGTASVANNGAVTPTLPTRNVGDLLVCVAAVSDATNLGITLSTASAWTAIGTAYNGGLFPNLVQRLWYRIATNDANDAITVTPTGGGAGDVVVAQVYQFRYTHVTTPVVDAKHEVGQANATGIDVPHPAYNSGSTSVANNNPTNVDQGGLLMIWAGHGANQGTTATPTVDNPQTYTGADEAAFSFTLRDSVASATGDDISLWMATAPNPVANSVAFQAFINWNQTFTSTAYMRGALALKPTEPYGYSVHLGASLAAKSTATLDLSSQTQQQMSATLSADAAATLDLSQGTNHYLESLLESSATSTLTLNVEGANQALLTGFLRCRAVAEVDYLHLGPAVHLQAVAACSAAVSRPNPYFNRELSLSVAAKATITRAILYQDIRLLLLALASRSGSTLTISQAPLLSGTATASPAVACSLTVAHPLSLSVACSSATSLDLSYEVRLGSSLVTSAMATAVLGSTRSLAGNLFDTSSAWLVVASDRNLAGFVKGRASTTLTIGTQAYLSAVLRCKVTTTMNLDIYRYEERFYPQVTVHYTVHSSTVDETPAGDKAIVSEPEQYAAVGDT